MDLNLIFQLSIFTVLPFWALMVLLPKWSWTQRIIASPWIVLPSALLYATLTVPGYFSSFEGGFNFFDLAQTAQFFGQESVTLGNWMHFAAMDLFAGRWIFLDAQKRAIPIWGVSIIVLGCLISAPTVLVIYLIIRQFRPLAET